jgi:DNA-binding response OmpR family regulator
MRLMLVEDNFQLADFLKSSLGKAGFAVHSAGTAEAARAALESTRYDAVVVDLGLPDADGIILIEELRAKGDSTPAMILTARDGLRDRVDGLDKGADDYLAKPFATEELIARLRALLRRPGNVLGRQLSCANLSFDTSTREVLVSGAIAALSRREISLLELLMRRSGRVVPKQAIEESLYGLDDGLASNSVEVLVHRLRRRLAALGAEVNIVTLRGIGYVLTDQTE